MQAKSLDFEPRFPEISLGFLEIGTRLRAVGVRSHEVEARIRGFEVSILKVEGRRSKFEFGRSQCEVTTSLLVGEIVDREVELFAREIPPASCEFTPYCLDIGRFT